MAVRVKNRSNKLFDVTEIQKHEKNTSRNKAYEIGSDLNILQDVLDPEMWPENIIVKKFQFFRSRGGEETHKNQNETELATFRTNEPPQGRKSALIFHQNIQSLKHKTSEIESTLKALNEAPKILCFTEDWCTQYERPFVKIEGYKKIASYSRTARSFRLIWTW
ncbi:hypothetical protein HHI36_000631 [Cryptolaemus montrouzieri]|uniref:Uncharacterized protein n=1 Tax=Cryptolaemus montrouzieri TaxID=559131 RepID=A0ABD2P602_9CUCU